MGGQAGGQRGTVRIARPGRNGGKVPEGGQPPRVGTSRADPAAP